MHVTLQQALIGYRQLLRQTYNGDTYVWTNYGMPILLVLCTVVWEPDSADTICQRNMTNSINMQCELLIMALVNFIGVNIKGQNQTIRHREVLPISTGGQLTTLCCSYRKHTQLTSPRILGAGHCLLMTLALQRQGRHIFKTVHQLECLVWTDKILI